jgi:hypothetical protein
METDITAGRQVVIIVGAGASCDHSKDRSSCPPLARDLARELRSTLPQFAELEEKVGRPCEEDFEKWTEQIEKRSREAAENHTDILWCLSKYFVRFKEIPDDSLYLNLIEEIVPDLLQKTLFVSLNYEVLLEMAIREKGYRAHAGTGNLDSFNDLQAGLPEIPVIKPHGSCHYRVQMNVTSVGCGRIAVSDPSSNMTLGPTISEDPFRIDEEMKDFSTSIPSVISAFNPEKSSSFNRLFIESARNRLLTRMKDCRKMALIGVNFRPYDHFINEVVKTGLEAGASIGFVGDEEAFNNYCALVSPLGTNYRYLGTKFRDELDSLMTFLKSQT